jgi:HEAT repeat protein
MSFGRFARRCARVLLVSLIGLAAAGLAASQERLYLGRTAAEWENDLGGEGPEIRRRAALALARFGSQAVPPLVEALADPDGTVRAAAARALGEIGAEARDAVPALTQALVDENAAVRQSAERALKSIDGQ